MIYFPGDEHFHIPELAHEPRSPPPRVVCVCGHEIWDGEAIRSRCVIPASGEALCRCKRWVGVPVAIRADLP